MLSTRHLVDSASKVLRECDRGGFREGGWGGWTGWRGGWGSGLLLSRGGMRCRGSWERSWGRKVRDGYLCAGFDKGLVCG